jgi:hypothetical protein
MSRRRARSIRAACSPGSAWRSRASASGASAPPAAAPAGFDALLGLQALGYDIRAPGAARAAFRRHFLGSEGDAELAPDEQALLHCLLQKKLQRDPSAE